MLASAAQFFAQNYDYTYTTLSNSDSNSASAGVLIAYFVCVFIVAVASIAGLWKMLTKAGRPGWAAIVPIYESLQTLWMAGKPWWWLLLMLIPIVNIVFAVMLCNALSKSFGKGVGMTLLLIFLPFIGYPMLGFGSAKYQGTKPTADSVPTPPAAGAAPTPA